MTEKEWKTAEEKINFTTPLKLRIDGYDVMIRLEAIKSRMILVFTVYINGYLKGEWLDKDSEIAQKFYWRREKSFYSRKSIKRLEKIWGKREAKKQGAYDKHVYYHPFYHSFNTLKNTLKSNNKEIELISPKPAEE